MQEVLAQLFSALGSLGLIAILAIACLVWALAHFNSEAGKEVSVLWGLVTYTKAKRANSQQISQIVVTPPDQKSAKKQSEESPIEQPLNEGHSDFVAGKSLKPLEYLPSDPIEDVVYMKLTASWVAGAAKALEGHTSDQARKKLKKSIGNLYCMIEGRVGDVEAHYMIVENTEFIVPIIFENSTCEFARKAAGLHKGDWVRLSCQIVSPPQRMGDGRWHITASHVVELERKTAPTDSRG